MGVGEAVWDGDREDAGEPHGVDLLDEGLGTDGRGHVASWPETGQNSRILW